MPFYVDIPMILATLSQNLYILCCEGNKRQKDFISEQARVHKVYSRKQFMRPRTKLNYSATYLEASVAVANKPLTIK